MTRALCVPTTANSKTRLSLIKWALVLFVKALRLDFEPTLTATVVLYRSISYKKPINKKEETLVLGFDTTMRFQDGTQPLTTLPLFGHSCSKKDWPLSVLAVRACYKKRKQQKQNTRLITIRPCCRTTLGRSHAISQGKYLACFFLRVCVCLRVLPDTHYQGGITVLIPVLAHYRLGNRINKKLPASFRPTVGDYTSCDKQPRFVQLKR